MFSFHKPKVYRSPSGCCICKAKSSSSRFTDSKKYESDFVECFQLQEPRSGEVCNACVLLVKRWKKLPEGSQRNWRHVVDARAGPGTKSATKFKSKQKRKAKSKSATATVMAATAGLEEEVEEEKEKERRRRRSKAIMEVEEEEEELDEQMREQSPSSALSDEIIGGDLSDLSVPPSPTPSEDAPSQLPLFHPPHRTRSMLKRLAPPLPLPAVSGFIDTNFWKREKVCCGIVFKGPNGQIIIDSRFFKPCHARRQQQQQQQPPHDVVPQVATTPPPPPPPPLTNTTTTTTTAKVAASTTTSPPYSDTSSDSGYDESSNQSSEVTSSLIIVGPSVPPLPVTAAANNNNNSNN